MNYGMSVLFRAIPLIMGVICLTFGWYVLAGSPDNGVPGAFVAGHVLLNLVAICVALFCTAATIIKQLILPPGKTFHTLMPHLGYLVALVTICIGVRMFLTQADAPGFVSGHVVFGLGLISCCVSTVAAASTRFTQIPVNSEKKAGDSPQHPFSPFHRALMLLIPAACAVAALALGLSILFAAGTPEAPEALIAGHVLSGIGIVCASLVALVASVSRQINNTYSEAERRFWPLYVLLCGCVNILWGAWVLWRLPHPVAVAPGYVLIGLGIVCWSICSKVLLLAMVWRRSAPLAKRVPLIPVFTALACLFIAAFLFQAAVGDPAAYAVPARVMVGLGAVCFTLFSIVSILESGTSS